MAANTNPNPAVQEEKESTGGRSLNINFPLTKEDDWEVWSDSMIEMLVDEKLLEYHEGKDGKAPTMNWLATDSSARASRAILQNCSVEFKKLLVGCKTATERWDKLYKHFSGTNLGRRLLTIKKMAKFKFSEEKMLDNIRIMETFIRDLTTAAGSNTISIEDLGLALLLHALPSSYAHVRSALENDKNVTMATAKDKILNEEQSQLAALEADGTEGFSGFTQQRRGDRRPKGERELCPHRRSPAKCWTCDPSKHPSKAICKDCNQKGHFSRNSSRCNKHEVPRVPGTPNGTAGTAVAVTVVDVDAPAGLTPSFTTDEDDWTGADRKVAAHAPAFKSKGKVTKRVSPQSEKRSVFGVKAKAFLRFILDSGCTNTLLSNKHVLTDYTELSNFNMGTADGSPMKCPGKGTLTAESLSLKDVLHCPDTEMNLMSVSQLCDLGLIGTFTASGCHFRKVEGGKPVLVGRREGNLYYYDVSEAGSALAVKSTAKTELAHRRMGHLNHRALKLLSHLSTGLELDGTPTNVCEPCAKAKSHRGSFPRSYHRATRSGEVVHTDECQMPVPTVNGNHKHFVTFIDDCTRFITVYLLNKKSDAIAAFMDYDARIFNLTGRHVSTLRSDGGGEFINKVMADYCRKHGVFQEFSTPHTPQHNSRAERPNRTIVESACALLFDANLPKGFWGYAVLMVVWLRNRSPHSALYRRTPYEAWTGVKPDLSDLHVFGTKAFVHIPKVHRKKLDPHSVAMVFVGYSEKSKAWVFYNLETKSEVRSNDVIFGDELFPCDAEFGNTPEGANTLIDLYHECNPLPKVDQPMVENIMHQGGNAADALVQDVEMAEADIGHEPDDDSNEPADADIVPGMTIEADALDDSTDAENEYDTVSEESEDELVSYGNVLLALAANELAEFEDWSNALLATAPIDDSPTFADAMNGPYRKEFNHAIAKEYESLSKNNVFSEPCDLPDGFKALDTKMVLKIKESAVPGVICKFKARLCGKGFKQEYGVDFFNTYAPVAAYNSIRVFISLCAMLDYEMDCVDVITAFLLAPLSEEIYIKIPDGYPTKPGHEGKVLRLNKSLYGLKQAPHDWNKAVDAHLRSMQFTPTVTEPCLYVGQFEGKTCYICLYVDDMLIATPNRSLMAKLKASIDVKYPIEDRGPLAFFLNMHFTRDRVNRTVKVHQQTKIEKVLKDLDMMDCVPSKTPADPSIILTKDMCPTDPADIAEMSKLPYKSVIGKLLYIAITARPDIAPAVSAVGRYSQNPGKQHWNAVLRVLQYLKSTKDYTLTLGGAVSNVSISAYSDSDWAGDLDKRRSRTGYAVFMGDYPVIWCSKLQVSVALSSTEAEYMALSSTTQEVLWLRKLLKELGFTQQHPTVIYEDNKSCIDIASTFKNTSGSKHIDIRHHFIRDRVLTFKDIVLERKATGVMTADLLTKQLPFPAFSRHRNSLGVVKRGEVETSGANQHKWRAWPEDRNKTGPKNGPKTKGAEEDSAQPWTQVCQVQGRVDEPCRHVSTRM